MQTYQTSIILWIIQVFQSIMKLNIHALSFISVLAQIFLHLLIFFSICTSFFLSGVDKDQYTQDEVPETQDAEAQQGKRKFVAVFSL